MPEKPKESKIKTMLERGGFIRKVEDVPAEPVPGSLLSRSDSDIKPLFDVPENTVKVTPASRQPIPGMPSPVFPSEIPVEAAQEVPMPADGTETKLEREYSVDAMRPASESPAEEPPTSAPPPVQSAYVEPPAQPVYAEPPAPAPQQRPAPIFGGMNRYRNDDAPENTPYADPYAASSSSQPENYTDRYLNIDELFDALALRSKKTDTVYLIEEYLQTLPSSLPDSSRREIVGKIISASGFDYDLLMGDGVLRVKMLKEYAERFARYTDDYIAARQSELDELDQQILRTRRLIENRKELHKKQFFTIEAEAQRLKEILTFISG